MNQKVDLCKELTLDELKIFFHKVKDEIKRRHEKSARKDRTRIGVKLAIERARLVDELIGRILKAYNHDKVEGVCMVALGGYGRQELCPYSDIDLLFLYEPTQRAFATEISKRVLYFLWDLGLEVGYSVRTIEECLKLSQSEDSTVLTSLLDGRYVLGERFLYKTLTKEIYDELLPSVSAVFISEKLEERRKRIEKYGSSVYLLEPNVKESKGGLRDFHNALWIAQARYKVKGFLGLLSKGIISEKEYETIKRSLNYLLVIRFQLHYLAGRREDRLGFEYQEKIAKFLGYKDGRFKAVEKFMRIYYLRASLVHEQTERIIEKCVAKSYPRGWIRRTRHLEHGFIIQGGQLTATSKNIFKEDPVNLIRAFELADKHGVEMSRYLIWLIRENVTMINNKVRRDPRFNEIFLRILKSGKNVKKQLLLMNEVRLLGHYIPEFGKIVCLAQHDAYHIYTVDIHSIFAVGEVENLLTYKYEKEFPFLTKVAESVVKRHVLYLACLLHDVGKGAGTEHSEKGAAIVSRVASRMGLSSEGRDQLVFLVRHHLVMSHLSQRRDIHDPSLIERFATLVKSIETLSLLYLLTFSDMRSVGPDVWSNWKDMLLRELYLRTAKLLERGEYTEESIQEMIQRVVSRVIAETKGKVPAREVKKILAKMPDSYFRGYSPKAISRHVELIYEKGVEGTVTDVKFHLNEGYDEFTYWGYDKKGIFSKMCGVLSASGLNILGARIVTTRDGRIIDDLYVNKQGKSTWDEPDVWKKVTLYLKQAEKNEIDIDRLIEKRKRSFFKYKKFVPTLSPRVDIDNETSSDFTIIDVYAPDRPGLLYDITKALSDLDLSINYAKVSTQVDQVIDVFYVTDLHGKKIQDPKKLEEVKTSLLNAIAES